MSGKSKQKKEKSKRIKNQLKKNKEKIKELKQSFLYKKSNKNERKMMIKNVKSGHHPNYIDINELFGEPVISKSTKKGKKMKGGAEPEKPKAEPKAEEPKPKAEEPKPKEEDPIDSFLKDVNKSKEKRQNNEDENSKSGKGLKDELMENMKGLKKNVVSKYSILEDEENFDFFKKQEILERQLEGEGLYLVGINFKKIVDLVQEESKLKQLEVRSKFPGTTEEEKKKISTEMEKLKKVMEEREKNPEPSYDLLGEYIDEDFQKVSQEISQLQDEISETSLNPQKVFDRRTTFMDILTESKKYKKDVSTVTPKAIYLMVQILDKKKDTFIQWTRVASFCEIIYKYLNKGETREEFFSSTKNLNELVLSELEEFWKTDFIFRGNEERKTFKDSLDFYKHQSTKSTNNNEKSNNQNKDEKDENNENN